jgi:hypothetical protein
MKQKKFSKKLVFNKSTVADLTHSQMNQAKGGALVITYSKLVRCYVCESDGDPCETIQSICPCATSTCPPPPSNKPGQSICERCFG